MQNIIKSVTLFILPYGFILLFAVMILFYSNEIFGVDKVISCQVSSRESALFGLAYSDPVKYYKTQRAKDVKPDILVMGSSRVMQFRSQFFKDDYKFYNSGGAVNKIRLLRLVLNELPSNDLPELMIVGIDQWWFNEKMDDLKTRQFDIDLKQPRNDLRIIMDSWRKVYFDIFKGKISLTMLEQNSEVHKFGLSALMQNKGYRSDGSYYYGNFNYQNSTVETMQNELRLLQNQQNWFFSCTSVNTNALDELELFVKKCKELNIQLLGFMPPYAPMIYKKMENQKEAYVHVFKLDGSIKAIFENEGYSFLNYTDPLSVNLSDKEFVDGVHASEKGYLKIFINMLERNEMIGKYADFSFLKNTLNASKENIEVFGYN